MKYFSSEAVGKDGDGFTMAESASNNAKGILKLKKHVSVVSLNADTQAMVSHLLSG